MSELLNDFPQRYKDRYSMPEVNDEFNAATEALVVERFLTEIQTKGPSLTVYHGTHSGFIYAIETKTLLQPLYLAVSPFHSAQIALMRSYQENIRSRIDGGTPGHPVLYEVQIDLRDLAYEVFYPSPEDRITKQYGLGISRDYDTGLWHLSDILLVGDLAEQRLQMGHVAIVSYGEDLISLLQWSSEQVGGFDLDFLLPKR